MGLQTWYPHYLPVPLVDLKLSSSNGCFGNKKVLASVILPHPGDFDLNYTVNGKTGSVPLSDSTDGIALAEVSPGVPVHYQVELVEQEDPSPLYEGEDTLSNPADYCDDGGGGGSGGGAGGDHPDDNYSAAGSIIPDISFSALPTGARIPPRVAILQRGSARNLQWLAFQVGELGTFIDPDFDPVLIVEHFPVLLIPSGSLYGLENSPAFHARLEEYARLGGVIVAFSCSTYFSA